jgi:hypothetical protein
MPHSCQSNDPSTAGPLADKTQRQIRPLRERDPVLHRIKRVIISGATLAKEKYRTRRLGEVAVKGKQIPTEIFALLG